MIFTEPTSMKWYEKQLSLMLTVLMRDNYPSLFILTLLAEQPTYLRQVSL